MLRQELEDLKTKRGTESCTGSRATHTRELLREGEQSQPLLSSTLPPSFAHTPTRCLPQTAPAAAELVQQWGSGYRVQFCSRWARIKATVTHSIALLTPFPSPCRELERRQWPGVQIHSLSIHIFVPSRALVLWRRIPKCVGGCCRAGKRHAQAGLEMGNDMWHLLFQTKTS